MKSRRVKQQIKRLMSGTIIIHDKELKRVARFVAEGMIFQKLVPKAKRKLILDLTA